MIFLKSLKARNKGTVNPKQPMQKTAKNHPKKRSKKRCRQNRQSRVRTSRLHSPARPATTYWCRSDGRTWPCPLCYGKAFASLTHFRFTRTAIERLTCSIRICFFFSYRVVVLTFKPHEYVAFSTALSELIIRPTNMMCDMDCNRHHGYAAIYICQNLHSGSNCLTHTSIRSDQLMFVYQRL